MSEVVSWLIEVTIKPAAFDAFRSLTDEMVAATEEESGALIYERFLSSDEAVAHLYERYADSSAAVQHLETFRERFASRFLETVDRTRVVVYGPVSGPLRSEFDRMGATYLDRIAGFAR